MKKNDTQNFERKSRFNESRDSYVDDQGNYVYTEWVKKNGKWEREVVATIPLTAETRDIIICLDESDHACDLQERYTEENADYSIRNKRQKADKHEDGEEFDTDPLEQIPDRTPNFIDDEPVTADPLVQQVEEFIRNELTEEQQNLLFAHLGECRFLEDIRREEETATGKVVSKQAVHNRWNRIVTKACKHFGVDKPKQEHKKRQ